MTESGDIDAVLAELRRVVQATLRAEQLRDRLTGLGNDEALTELLESKVEAGTEFWSAFVEVDKFKDINDEFEYKNADMLLQRIGERLRNVALDYFPGGAIPFRAHGDEFFLVGDMHGVDAGQLQHALAGLRLEISSIRMGVRDKPRPMQCTVSVAWLLSRDAQKSKAALTERSVRTCLELAIAQAKIDRNAVVQFTPEMEKAQVRHGRADCRACSTKFSVAIPVGKEGLQALSCPNCSANVPRPPALSSQNNVPEGVKTPTANQATASVVAKKSKVKKTPAR
jgi:diguanylate cyclase (GGDEF)-like protein